MSWLGSGAVRGSRRYLDAWSRYCKRLLLGKLPYTATEGEAYPVFIFRCATHVCSYPESNPEQAKLEQKLVGVLDPIYDAENESSRYPMLGGVSHTGVLWLVSTLFVETVNGYSS